MSRLFLVLGLAGLLVLPACGGSGAGTPLLIGVGTGGGGIPPTGPITDLNGNGIDDAQDITSGSSLDVNGNGIVDEVEIDIDNDSVPDGRINAGSVFEDADNDGTRDAGESGVAGVTVTAYDVAANVVGTDVTDANGDWRIDDV
nr:SdrD B-like domain-containing protein [Planctomycetota bacterium]